MCPESCERASKTAKVRPSRSTVSATDRSLVVCLVVRLIAPQALFLLLLLEQQLVAEGLGGRREGAVAAPTRPPPPELLVEPSPSSVPREHAERCAVEPAAAQDVEH